MYTAAISKIPRHFIPDTFRVTDWVTLEPYFQDLEARDISSKIALEQWLTDLSELEAVVSEDACWRQIHMTCDTENKSLETAFNFFYQEIQPKLQPFADRLNKKLLASTALQELDPQRYKTYLRNIKKNVSLFRESNIPIQSEISILQQQYGQITGSMTVMVNGNEYTLQQAAKFLESHNRNLRETVYRAMQERRFLEKEKLDTLFDTLLKLRNQEALNAGFENYRDYRFEELGRFDYKKEDCYAFHNSVKTYVVPVLRDIYRHKSEQLNISPLRPWDLEAEPTGTNPLHPFETSDDLLEKSIECLSTLQPFFGDCLNHMRTLKHLDLESRKGKAPGGYNCPLPESGAPFIFMNAAGQMHDVTTLLHESGHAIHSFLSHPLELTGFKEYPTEMAEVASMAMELMSMDAWDVFFKDPNELRRAKLHQLERVISIFPWIAIIDQFQHWIYENPSHSHTERTNKWIQILNEYKDNLVDYSTLETYRSVAWQRQLHLFEVPFYYIEYGISQLGAIGLWIQFRKNKQKAIDAYCKALSLGGTKTLPELFHEAGLEFDFSPEKVKTLMEFVQEEFNKLLQPTDK